MRMLNVMVMAWAVLVLQLTAVCGTDLHYNEALLKTYIRLSQQLRAQTFRTRFSLQMRTVASSNDVMTKAIQIDNTKIEAFFSLGDAMTTAAEIGLRAKRIMTPALKAQMTETYTDNSQTLFGVVSLDHGTGYSGSAGQLVVIKSGVYMLEFKVQTADHRAFSTKIAVTSAAGDVKYTFTTYHDWEVSPFFEMLKLEAGDTVVMYPMNAIASWASTTSVVPGSATQFNLRYLGEYVPLGYTTAAPNNGNAATTNWWWG